MWQSQLKEFKEFKMMLVIKLPLSSQLYRNPWYLQDSKNSNLLDLSEDLVSTLTFLS